MPFEITIAIDPSKKIRKFMERPRSKNIIPEKNTAEWTNLSRADQDSQSSSDKEMRSVPITVYRSTAYESDYLSDQKESDNKEKDSSIFKRTGDSSLNEDTPQKSFSNNGLSANKKLTIVEPKTSLPGFFKKLFITNKKKENQPENEIGQIEQNGACDNAINAFNCLLEDENSLGTLVGKAFSLNTMVTIQSIEDDGKPNLILSGSIPFQLTTKHGVVNKKVHIKGKLYSPRKEEDNQSTADQKSNTSSTQSVIRMKVNEQFRIDSSQIEKVSWLTSTIITQEEYQNQDFYCQRQTYTPKASFGSHVEPQEKVSQDGQEQLRYITDIDEREPSLNIIGSGKLRSNPSLVTAFDHKKVQLPVTSITIARSKTRLIRFTDGTDFTEKVGRNVITLAAPEGILYFPEGSRDEMDDSYDSVVRRESVSGVTCEDNMFTRSCFQMAKDDGEYALSRPINNTKRFGLERSKRSGGEMKDLDPNTFYPPGNYNHIFTDRYNPLTWIYQNFDKTKRFVQEFNC